MADSEWEQLAHELGERLVDLEEGDTIILRCGVYYTQCQMAEDLLHADAVSNHHLPPASRLSADQEEQLQALGWLPPSPPGYFNFYVQEDLPFGVVEGVRLASMMLSALREVYGIDCVSRIEEEAFNAFESGPVVAMTAGGADPGRGSQRSGMRRDNDVRTSPMPGRSRIGESGTSARRSSKVTAQKAIGRDALRDLLVQLRDTSWSWAEAEVPALAERLGWTLVEVLPGLGAIVDAGHGLGAKAFRVNFDQGSVRQITVRVSSLADEEDAAAQRYLEEVFVTVQELGVEVFGRPASPYVAPARPYAATVPQVRWRDEQATLALRKLRVAVTLTWTSNPYQDAADATDQW